MNHVHSIFAFLLLLLLLNSHTNLFIKADSVTESPQVSETSNISGRRVVIGELRETAILESPDRVSWSFVDEAFIYSSLRTEILAAIHRIERLGVRIYSIHKDNMILFHYKRSLKVDGDLLNPDEISAHEAYPPSVLCGQADENVLNVHLKMPADSLMPVLMEAIENNQLIRATLILNSRPELATQLPEEFYSRNILTSNYDLKGVHKHFIMQKNTEKFMRIFLNGFLRVEATETEKLKVLLVQVLKELLIDLKITDETVKIAFNTLLDSEEFLESMKGENQINFFVILSTFVSSQRPLTINDEFLNLIIFGASGHEKERLSVLKLINPLSKLEEIVLNCFDAENAAALFAQLTSDKKIVTRLSNNFLMKTFIPKVIVSNDLGKINSVFSGSFIWRFNNIEKSGSVLVDAIKVVDWEVVKFLLGILVPKTKLPLFAKPYVTLAAAEAIKSRNNEMFIRLLENRFVSFSNTIIMEERIVTLLAVAFRFGNYDLLLLPQIKQFIDWDKCKDVRLYALGCENEELLRSLGAPSINSLTFSSSSLSSASSNKKSTHVPSPTGSPISVGFCHSSSSVSTLSPSPAASKRSFSETGNGKEPSDNEIKRSRPADSMSLYVEALDYCEDAAMLEVFKSMGEVELAKIQRIRSYNAMIMELYKNELYETLIYFLGKLTKPQQIIQVLYTAAQLGAEFIIRYYYENPYSNLRYTDNIVDRNIIAHLFKAKHPDLAFKLIEETGFNIRHSDSPEVNPEGDILLSATWSLELMDELLRMGASPNVKFHNIKTKKNVPLLEWAQAKGKTEMVDLLKSYM